MTTARAALRHCASGARDELLVARLQWPIASSEQWLSGVWMEILRKLPTLGCGKCLTDMQNVSLEGSIRVCTGEYTIAGLVFLLV